MSNLRPSLFGQDVNRNRPESSASLSQDDDQKKTGRGYRPEFWEESWRATMDQEEDPDGNPTKQRSQVKGLMLPQIAPRQKTGMAAQVASNCSIDRRFRLKSANASQKTAT